MNQSTQKAIKIDSGLFESLTDWLTTKEAKLLGYHSKAQFATEAIREKLIIRKWQTENSN